MLSNRLWLLFFVFPHSTYHWASQVVLVVKNLQASTGDARDPGSIPGWGRSAGVGNGTPLQYSCLGNPMDRGAWWTPWGPWARQESDGPSIAQHLALPEILSNICLWSWSSLIPADINSMMEGKTENVLVTAVSLVPETVPGTQWMLCEYMVNE